MTKFHIKKVKIFIPKQKEIISVIKIIMMHKT